MAGRRMLGALREQDQLPRELLFGVTASDRFRRKAMGLSATLASDCMFRAMTVGLMQGS